MALSDCRLALLAFVRTWDGANLTGSLLLLPSGDPTAPLFAGGAKPFAGTELSLQVVASGGSDAIAQTDTPGGGTILPTNLANALPLFQALAARFAPQDTSGAGGPPPTSARILKPLPNSYLARLPPGSARAASAATPEAFACALRGRQPNFPPDPPPTRPTAWGEVLSHALRNPALARALGLIRDFQINIDPAAFAGSGGWLYVTPGSADDGTGLQVAWTANPDVVRCYAALIPPLDAPRSLFSALLFPVSNPKSPITPDQEQLDRAFEEASAYGQGFARVVHVRQPGSVDTANEGSGTGVAPGSDTGVQIGWDDEQVSEWHNRQLAILLGAGGGTTLQAPIGVLGYRVDVRVPQAGEPPGADTGWASLMTATGGLPPAFAGMLPAFNGELVIEPAPTAVAGANEYWLPLYFAQWQGTQLGLRDDTARLLAGGIAAGVSPPPTASSFSAAGTPPRLLYGTTYQFRVRLADLTMQGPDIAAAPDPETPAQRATIGFARHVPPRALGVTTMPPAPAPQTDPSIIEYDSINLTRPRIGYPEALFTPRYGASDDLAAAARAALLAQLGLDPSGAPAPTPPASNTQLSVGLPDPDVVAIDIHVEARVLAGDVGDDVNSDGSFVTLYRTSRPVPSPSALPPTPPGLQLPPSRIVADVAIPVIELDFRDVPEIGDPTWRAGADSGALPLPRARDVRINLTPIADGPPGYFGSFVDPARTPPTVGLTAKLVTRALAMAEDNLFEPPIDGSPQLQAFAFRPVTDGDVVAGIMQRLAPALGLLAEGLTLRARAGERVVFGCSGALKHDLSADGARITFASSAELLGKWTLVYQAVLSRDWTWDGLKGRTLVARSFDPATGSTIDIGSIAIPRVVGRDALADTPDRTRTRIVFIHAIDPTALPNDMDGVSPRPPFWLHATIEGAAGDIAIDSAQMAVRLPLLVPPPQMPDVVSAGYALAPYAVGAGYAETAPRARRLWVELDSPVPPGLAIVARVLRYAPDPLLYHDDRLMAAPPPPDPDLPLDPEFMRQIVPGQLPDEDGAEAMRPLLPSSDSPNRFLVPLPVIDPAAPELFGLWTYEFRFARVTAAMVKLGYPGPVRWSTAHGRYSRPLRLSGVQHPAPALPVTAEWLHGSATQPPVVLATAPFATAVLDGQTVGDGAPRTSMAFALYAQVPQADGSSFRNVYFGHVVGVSIALASGPLAVGEVTQAAVTAAMDALELPRSAGLSVVAIEFLPPGGAQEASGAAPGRQPLDWLNREVFGQGRILRTSNLTPIDGVCGVLEPAGAPGH